MSSYVFITGATGGLGKAFAVECARRGWDLFLTDLESEKLDLLAGGLEKTYGVTVRVRPCDLTDLRARSALFEAVRAEGLRFHFLINVAGIDHEGLFLECSSEEVCAIVRLNVEATLAVTHALLERADPSTPLRIVNVSSLAAFYPMPVKATYAASKRFLLDFSLALRDEVRGRGATVTVLCPAGMPTTETNIRAIQAQGLLGQLTTQDVGAVAAQTIDCALRGGIICIPGFLNRVIRFLGSFVPPVELASLIGNRWRAVRYKSLLDTDAHG